MPINKGLMKNDQSEYLFPIPRSVTILLFFVLSITVWDGIRAWTALANWEIISRFHGNPFYIFATGSIWFILGIVLLLLIFKGSRHTLLFGLVFSILYALWYWFDRLFIQVVPTPDLTFSITVTLITLAIFNGILFWPSSQAFFKETQ
jgi:hypothetical protein